MNRLRAAKWVLCVGWDEAPRNNTKIALPTGDLAHFVLAHDFRDRKRCHRLIWKNRTRAAAVARVKTLTAEGDFHTFSFVSIALKAQSGPNEFRHKPLSYCHESGALCATASDTHPPDSRQRESPAPQPLEKRVNPARATVRS